MPADLDTKLPSASDEVLAALCKLWPHPTWGDLHVTVALSGGCDSIALLRSMLEVKHHHGGAGCISAVHVNHQLRGTESEEDALWCKQQCKKLGVPLKLVSGDVAKQSQAAGDGLEAAARDVRYKLLTEVAEQQGIRFVATAHTEDDQVETVLFRLLRGSGVQGLRGIPRMRPLTPAVTLVRPFLTCTRKKLEAYLKEIDQAYRTDSSNQELRFARNRLRNQLLPQLRSDFNQDVDAALLRLSAQANELQQFVESHARAVLDASVEEPVKADSTGGRIVLSLNSLSQEADVVVREALRLAWREAGLSEQSMNYSWWRMLAELAKSSSSNNVLNLPGNVHASIAGGKLVLSW